MANSTHIDLYGQSIGRISVDGAMVRGEGGPNNPQLVIPLEVQLDNQPDEAMLAIGRVQALFGTDQNLQPATAICPKVSEDLVGTNPAFRVTTRPTGQVTSSVELRFSLTPFQVEELERRRHASRGDIFNLYLQLEPTVIGLKNFNRHQPGSTPEPRIWDPKYGMYAELAWFWTANQSPTLRVDVETSAWIRRVLPGVGHDSVRLIEVTLPPPLPEQPKSVDEFDKAKAAFDARRYDDSVVACRGLLAMWASQLGATKTRPVAAVIAEQLRWCEDDERRQLLDALWKATTDFVNAPHHPESTTAPVALDARDARLSVLLTALLSEYLGSIAP